MDKKIIMISVTVVIVLLFAIIMFFILGKKSGGTSDDDNKLTIDNFEVEATSTQNLNNDPREIIDATNYNLPNLKYNKSDKSVYWKIDDVNNPDTHHFYANWFANTPSGGQWIKYTLNKSVEITKFRLYRPNVVSGTYSGFPSTVTVCGSDNGEPGWGNWTPILTDKRLKIIKHQIGKTDKYNVDAFIEFDKPYTFKYYVIQVNAVNNGLFVQVYIDIYS